MKVLVAGANGHTGRLILQYLVERGHEAYGMVRDEQQAPRLKNIGAHVVTGDLEKDLSDLVTGMDAVIFAAGSGSKTGPEKTKDVDRDGAINLIDTAKKQGVDRFVMLSSIFADQPDVAEGPFGYYLQMKGEADEHLCNSGLTYTIVRPGGLTHEEPTGKVQAAEDVERGSISRGDVADVIVTSLEQKNTYHKSFDLIEGEDEIPEALKKL
ncbi:SDR family oxidoreductase [Sediminibacillus sp. JSM 1682029]|uniref:SDR family oxidoreductase n=1 Tax=Sediminibacillus sp. JSM 1682029 TaxID=3229857 RepID=UPI0035246FF4